MAQTASDKYARVYKLLGDEGETSERLILSPNDKAALRHVLGMVNELASAVAYYKGSTVPVVIASCHAVVDRGEQ